MPAEDRLAMGKIRAEDHNKIFEHIGSFTENKEILKDFVHFLYSRKVLPVVVITPFTREYNRFVLRDMKEAVLELVDAVPEDVHFVDFNDSLDMFEATDFMDTDHLSEKGAKKVSTILAELFGQ